MSRRESSRRGAFQIYLAYTEYINGRDLVDLACYEILGDWYFTRDREFLREMARCSQPSSRSNSFFLFEEKDAFEGFFGARMSFIVGDLVLEPGRVQVASDADAFLIAPAQIVVRISEFVLLAC